MGKWRLRLPRGPPLGPVSSEATMACDAPRAHRAVLVTGISGPSLGQGLGCSQTVETPTSVLPPLPHVFVNTLASFGPEEVFKCVIYFSNYDNCYKIKI